MTEGDRHKWDGCSGQLAGDEWGRRCFADVDDGRFQRERAEILELVGGSRECIGWLAVVIRLSYFAISIGF